MRRILFLLLAILCLLTGCIKIVVENELPTAVIDSISPTAATYGEAVTFTGHGDAEDESSVVAYKWRSSLDGDLSTEASFQSSTLSEGTHIIYFKVQDDDDSWSDEVERTLIISSAEVTSPTEETSEPGSGAPSGPATSAGMPYIESFTADPGTISLGESSTVSWSVSNAESITIDFGTGVDTVPPSGTATARPSTTTTYTLTATGGGATVSATVEIIVSGIGLPAPTPTAGVPVINSFAASPGTIVAGDSASLNYSVSNADTITLSSTAGSKVATLVSSSSSIPVEPTSTTTYTITAINSAGSVTATAKITVTAAAAQTEEFPLVISESGSINSDHVVSPMLISGDTDADKAKWAYFSFNISTIAGKEVTNAQLVYPVSALEGKPWPDLVSLGIYQVNHGPRALQPSDFTFAGPDIAVGLSQLQTILPVDVTSQVQSAVAARAPRFQVRLNFLRMTNEDGGADYIRWTTGDPKLRVTYR